MNTLGTQFISYPQTYFLSSILFNKQDNSTFTKLSARNSIYQSYFGTICLLTEV